MNKILKKALMFMVISSASLAHENSKFEYKLDYFSNESEENNDIYNEINYMSVGRAGNVVMAMDLSYKAISINDEEYNHTAGLSFMPKYIGTYFELGIRPYINKNIFKINYKKENMINLNFTNGDTLINASLYLKLKADFEMYNHDCTFAIFGNLYFELDLQSNENLKLNFTVFEPSFTFSNSEEISLFNKAFNYDVTLTYGLSKICQKKALTYGSEPTMTLISSINNLNVKSNQTLELWKLDSLNYVNLVVSESMFYTSSYDNIYKEEISNKCLAANIGITGSIATQFEMYINSTLLVGVFAESTIGQYEYNPYFKFNLTLGQIF